jgi:streptomycin 6-kinase
VNTFQSNILSIYGEKGKAWLDELPRLVVVLCSDLGLRDLTEVANLSYHYVLAGFQGDKQIILKLGLDSAALKQEALALKCFADHGAVKVQAQDEGMLLLERAVPGGSLRTYFPHKEQESVEIACMVMQKLHQASVPVAHNFPHIKDWCAALDQDWSIPDGYLQKTRQLRDQLLKTAGQDVLLHGDLHHDNILQNGADWVVIDPKGVIGEAAYDIAAFIRNPMPKLFSLQNAPEIIQNRIALVADRLHTSKTRVADWCFVQAVLAWAWALEDGCDPDCFQHLTSVFYKIHEFLKKNL